MHYTSFSSLCNLLINTSSQVYENDKESIEFLDDPIVKEKLENSQKLSEVNVDEYDAIYYVGGHGPVIDLPEDLDNIKLVSQVRHWWIFAYNANPNNDAYDCSFGILERLCQQSVMDPRKTYI